MSPSRIAEIKAMLPLCLVMFIDALGLGIMFPLLAPTILHPAGILDESTSIQMRNFCYGLILSIFPLIMFFSATLLGDLSDQIGRKKTLIICLLTTIVGYFLMGMAITLKSFTLFLLGRVLGGMAAGSEPIAQAAVMDISSPETKAHNMSFLVIPISLGVAAGPLIGALLSNEQLFTNTSLAVPLYFCAGLALINLLVLQRSFRETYVIQSKKINIAWRRCITVFTGFNQKNMIAMGMAFMFMQLSWSFYFNYITLYLVYKFNATSLAIGIFFSLQGLGFTMGSLLLVRFFLIYFSLLKASIFCGIIASFSILFSLLAGSENMVWIWGFVFAMACAAGYSMQLSLFSELVGSDRQGWVMGIAGSIGAVSWGGTALLTGIIASYSMSLPLLLTFVCMLFMIVASIVYSFYKKKRLEK